MRIAPLILTSAAAVLLVGVVGCDGSKPERVEAAGVSQAKDLPQLLSTMPAAITPDTEITFSAESVLAKDDALSDLKQGVRGMGAPSLARYTHVLKEDLAIDLMGADVVVTVGAPPKQVTLISGGQDAEAIIEAAKEQGWEGDKVLSQELDMQGNVLTVSVGHILAKGDSVMLGGQSADLTTKPGKLPESMKALSKCLGSSPVASIDGSDAVVSAIGLKQGSPVSGVICTVDTSRSAAKSRGEGIEEAVENDLSVTRLRYSDMLSVDKVSHPTATTSRVDVSFPDQRPPSVLWQMQQRRDIPGVSGPDPLDSLRGRSSP
ncbi:MAG: hypothetical protein ACTIJJ_09155 [Galactobacter sp.]